jgi:hypothetical protein
MKQVKSVGELIAKEHSRKNVTRIIRFVGDDQKRFDELMKIFLGKDEELARRAAWALSYIVIEHPSLVNKWFPKLIANLKKENLHPAIYRNTFRFMQVIEIPEKHTVEILNAAYKYVLNASNTAAVRAFALTTALNIASKYPELAGELRIVAQQVIKEDSKAMISRGKRTIRDLDRLIQ